MANKRYYWLKLNENFFERDEVKVIESMPNGKDYIIFYMKMLLKSIKTEGVLRFRDVIPYTPEMLSSITGTNIDTVKVAIDIFDKLGLLEIWDDGTLFMAETSNMIGSETDSAVRMRRLREESGTKELQAPSHSDAPVTNSDTDIEKELEKEKDICASTMHDDDFFNQIWKLYPNKKGKGQVKKTQRGKLQKIGFEELERCVKRYTQDIADRRKEFPELKYQNGSTFFNSGYVDYLDENYTESEQTIVVNDLSIYNVNGVR